MAESHHVSILDHFSDLDDPRVERTRRHKLVDIIAIAICATICGADSWVHVELFGRSKLEWFQTFLELPNGVPSHDTFGDVFARLDPEQFQSCFMAWTQAIAELLPGEVVAIDGKTARRSYDRAGSKRAMHLVSAWATRNTLTLGQVRTEEKSNEITAIPQLLNLLDLQGCIVTIDAMGCQREIRDRLTTKNRPPRWSGAAGGGVGWRWFYCAVGRCFRTTAGVTPALESVRASPFGE